MGAAQRDRSVQRHHDPERSARRRDPDHSGRRFPLRRDDCQHPEWNCGRGSSSAGSRRSLAWGGFPKLDLEHLGFPEAPPSPQAGVRLVEGVVGEKLRGAVRAVKVLVYAFAIAMVPDATAQVPAADSAWAAGDFHTARIGYERALAGDSASVRALYRLGVLASWDGKLDSSLTLLSKARSYEPADPDVRIAEARVISWKGDYSRAVQHYDSVLADHPDNREAALGRAQVLGWAGKYREADQQYALLMSVNPQDLDALAGRGQLAAWNGDYPLAVEYYSAALAVDSNHVRSLV